MKPAAAPSVAPAAVITAFPLLGVALTHDYYGGPFAAFIVKPLPATAAVCRRLGLRLTGSGGSLALSILPGQVPQRATPAHQALLSAQSLCWEIVPTDPHFAAFTGVDFAGPANALVFSSSAAGAKGGRLTASAKAAPADVWARQPLRFSFRPAHRLPSGAVLTLQTPARVKLRSYPVTDRYLVNIDTSDLGSGLYQLALGGKVLTQWFADERTPLAPMRGPVLVLPGSLLAAAAARTADVEPPAYTAALPARSVVWRYHVFNAVDATGLSIDPAANNSSSVNTSAGARSAISSARRAAAAPPTTQFHLLPAPVVPGAISFEATRALPLAAQAPQRFTLSRNGTELCSPLPLAGFAFARPAGGTAPCSDIFVHLQPQ